MAAFQEILAADAATFTNPAEFGSVVEFNGQQGLAATVEDVEYDAARHGYDGYNLERKRLYVALAALEEMVVPNQQTTLNGEYWQTGEVLEDDGLAEINLERNRS